MKKIILLSIVVTCISFGVKSQDMTVNGTDIYSPAPTTGDYWVITWIVNQWNPAHTAIIGTWEGSDLTLAYKILYYPQSNPWSTPCYFQFAGGTPPLIFTNDFQVTVSVKRWVDANQDYGPACQSKSSFMNTNAFTGSFTVNCLIQ